MEKFTLRGVLPLTRTFDQRYQMSRIQAGNVDVQYTRDAAGRVTNVTGIAEPTLTVGTEAYSVNSSNNQMTARGTVNYTYDAAGNLAVVCAHSAMYSRRCIDNNPISKPIF